VPCPHYSNVSVFRLMALIIRQMNSLIFRIREYFDISTKNLNSVVQNVMVEWLTLLFRIQKVSGSNIGSYTGYPD
jgi:hypothetical protein